MMLLDPTMGLGLGLEGNVMQLAPLMYVDVVKANKKNKASCNQSRSPHFL